MNLFNAVVSSNDGQTIATKTITLQEMITAIYQLPVFDWKFMITVLGVGLSTGLGFGLMAVGVVSDKPIAMVLGIFTMITIPMFWVNLTWSVRVTYDALGQRLGNRNIAGLLYSLAIYGWAALVTGQAYVGNNAIAVVLGMLGFMNPLVRVIPRAINAFMNRAQG